jgi:hypothetical protein
MNDKNDENLHDISMAGEIQYTRNLFQSMKDKLIPF